MVGMLEQKGVRAKIRFEGNPDGVTLTMENLG